MPDSRSILFASDLTARGDRPFDRAVMLAEEWGTGFTILHVVDKKSKANGKEDTELIASIRADLPDVDTKIEVVVAHGPVTKTIAAMAEERGADIVLTGVARHNSFGDFTLGTAVDYIVRNATVPVLVVKKRPQGPYRTILVATDFSSCSKQALIEAAMLFPEAKLTLAHGVDLSYGAWLKSEEVEADIREEAEEQMDAFLGDPDLASIVDRLDAKIGYGNRSEALYRFQQEIDADLFAVGTHGKSGFVQATLGSTAQTMLEWSPIDVLMVREAK